MGAVVVDEKLCFLIYRNRLLPDIEPLYPVGSYLKEYFLPKITAYAL